ncbi:protein PTHB1-like [Mya arenaria]|uniref:protein PTHB1-like n=1 Tax=Mya arenaria TaxID=6604 RepID=UPI0022E919ED|nr:protein PTHB1-like [Mya arenaria]
MSLFKARDWWSTSVGEEEEFDNGCLCVANVDNSTDEIDKIVIGSYHGILRIFNPKPTKTENGWSGFRPEDVLLESPLQNPILQLETGKFVSGSDKLHLAILHPRKLAVYNVAAMTGAVEHGIQYQMTLAYEHKLQRTAFNFCFGPFGQVKGKDFICVQSMDGTVSIFEQESFAFSRFLPNALLPGPIKYLPRLDSFITVSSQWQLECYKYQVLAQATDSKSREESQSIKSGKRVIPDWCFNIGEQAVDLAVVSFQTAPPSILVLGERNLFCLTETGQLRFMKKFDYDVSCFTPYASITEGSINYLLASHTQTLMIYQDIGLKWAAKLDSVPIMVRVGNFHELKGVIVTLSDTGRLECSYLGTDPSLFIPPPVESRELNYGDMDREMAQLQKVIKDQQAKSAIMPNLTGKEEDLTIYVHVSPNLDDVSMATGVEIDGEPVPSITVRIQMKSRLRLENIKLTVHVQWPLASNLTNFTIPSVDPGQPSESFCAFFIRGKALPADLSAQVSAKYISTTGAVRIASAHIKLPLKLIVKPVLPVKNALFKITLDTNKQPTNLNDIFPDLLGENAGGQGAALGFQYFGGPVVTVLASKTSNRYRLQCDLFEGLWYVVRDLSSRLNNHFNKGNIKGFNVSFTGQVPLNDYFDIIENHFEHRMNAESCKEMLSQRASQFRAIQRRLLTRFKDKTPAPLQNLDTLLEGTYRQLIHLAETIQENDLQLEVAANALSCATNLFNFILKLWTNMSEEEFAVLQSSVTGLVVDTLEAGWEETVDASVTHLLRTVLAKSAKDQTLNPAPLKLPEDTSKVKKHLALLCDKLSKGARLVDGLPMNTGVSQADKPEKKNKVSSTRQTVIENGDMDHHDNDDNTETLIGSQFSRAKNRDRDDMNSNGLPSLKPLASKIHEPDGVYESKKKKDKIAALVPDLEEMNYEAPNLLPLDDD